MSQGEKKLKNICISISIADKYFVVLKETTTSKTSVEKAVKTAKPDRGITNKPLNPTTNYRR
jgi:hypothetical protein